MEFAPFTNKNKDVDYSKVALSIKKKNRKSKFQQQGQIHRKVPNFVDPETGRTPDSQMRHISYTPDEIYRHKVAATEMRPYDMYEDVIIIYVHKKNEEGEERISAKPYFISALRPTKDFMERLSDDPDSVTIPEERDYYLWLAIEEDVRDYYQDWGFIDNNLDIREYFKDKGEKTGLAEPELEVLEKHGINSVQKLAGLNAGDHFSKETNKNAILLRNGKDRWEDIILNAVDYVKELQAKNDQIQAFKAEEANDPEAEKRRLRLEAAEAKREAEEAKDQLRKLQNIQTLETEKPKKDNSSKTLIKPETNSDTVNMGEISQKVNV